MQHHIFLENAHNHSTSTLNRSHSPGVKGFSVQIKQVHEQIFVLLLKFSFYSAKNKGSFFVITNLADFFFKSQI